MYRWLLGEIEEVEIRHPAAFSESNAYKSHCARLYWLYTHIKIDTRIISFMCKVAVGALKTGEVVRKYKIPGARCSCIFCGEKELETVEHLFLLCPALKTIRAIAIQYYQYHQFGVTFPVVSKAHNSIWNDCCYDPKGSLVFLFVFFLFFSFQLWVFIRMPKLQLN